MKLPLALTRATFIAVLAALFLILAQSAAALNLPTRPSLAPRGEKKFGLEVGDAVNGGCKAGLRAFQSSPFLLKYSTFEGCFNGVENVLHSERRVDGGGEDERHVVLEVETKEAQVELNMGTTVRPWCKAHPTAAKCDHAAACVWCASAAVPSACYSKTSAARLPPAVFECT